MLRVRCLLHIGSHGPFVCSICRALTSQRISISGTIARAQIHRNRPYSIENNDKVVERLATSPKSRKSENKARSRRMTKKSVVKRQPGGGPDAKDEQQSGHAPNKSSKHVPKASSTRKSGVAVSKVRKQSKARKQPGTPSEKHSKRVATASSADDVAAKMKRLLSKRGERLPLLPGKSVETSSSGECKPSGPSKKGDLLQTFEGAVKVLKRVLGVDGSSQKSKGLGSPKNRSKRGMKTEQLASASDKYFPGDISGKEAKQSQPVTDNTRSDAEKGQGSETAESTRRATIPGGLEGDETKQKHVRSEHEHEDHADPPKRPEVATEVTAESSAKAFKKTPGKKAVKEIVDVTAKKIVKKKAKTAVKTSGKAAVKTMAKTTAGKNGKDKTAIKFESVDPGSLALEPIRKKMRPVPGLSYGLDRVLFNPGVYQLQDPRSRVYNFDPYLARIMPVREFDYDALTPYITSSKDNTLIDTAAEHKKKYTGSTSSMTSTLAHFHYLLSAFRGVNLGYVSRKFEPDSAKFTKINLAPVAVFLHNKGDVYAIDADKEFDRTSMLSMLGKSMEKLLTLPKEEYEKYRRSKSQQLSDQARNSPESYHYTTLGDFMMRAQLDAHDARIPGTGMFDLKTRAVVSIRMDARVMGKGLGYEIRDRFGQYASFEREYHDMIRSAFLKYSLQVRMGRMDGIFVAFHNTERIFGFQYISLPEMDHAIHGTSDTSLGDREFKLSLYLLNKILDKATDKYPGRTLRLYFESRDTNTPLMYIFARPIMEGEIQQIQGAAEARNAAFERQMMGVMRNSGAQVWDETRMGSAEAGDETIVTEDGKGFSSQGGEDEEAGDANAEGQTHELVEEDESSLAVWEDMMSKVENTLENEEQGVSSIREAIEEALEQSGLLRTSSAEESKRYLDSLFQALTSSVREDGREMDDTDNESMDDEQEASSAWTEPESPTHECQASRLAEAEGEQDAEASLDEAKSSDGPTPIVLRGEEPKARAAPVVGTSLKDLILRLASQVQSNTGEQAPAQDESRDQLDSEEKLREFESVLSELIIKTHPPIVQIEQEMNSATVSKEVTSGDATHEQAAPATARDKQIQTIPPQDSTRSRPAPRRCAPESQQAKEAEHGEDGEPSEDLLGMVLTIKNKVNGSYEARPENLGPEDSWTVEYSIEEMGAQRARCIFEMLKLRREKAMTQACEGSDDLWRAKYMQTLGQYSTAGREFRARDDEQSKARGLHVYGAEGPLGWEEVYGETPSTVGTRSDSVSEGEK